MADKEQLETLESEQDDYGTKASGSASSASYASDKLKPEDLLPKKKDIENLQHFFGKREIAPFDNSEILRSRLLYQVESSKVKGCYDILNKDTGKVLGTVSRLKLDHAWRMAHSKYAHNVVKNRLFFMKESEWVADKNKLANYIRSKRPYYDSDETVFFADVWALSEIEYESIGLARPQQFMALLQTAILGEMEENRRLAKAWHKIKRYMYRVPLEASGGGIFSSMDAAKLKRVLNIKHLNDIKKLNILVVKNAVLDFDFVEIVDDINAAFKEDMAKRIDKRFKVRPFVAAFANLAIILYMSYKAKYTLINNVFSTRIIMLLLSLCVVDVIAIIAGGIRAKFRRRKRYDYIYYTTKVRKAIRNFALIGIFTVASVFVFYQRYDGYTERLYYRDLDDGTVAVAGLFDKEITELDIPEYIEGRTVTEIDLYAFNKSDLKTVSMPDTVKVIDRGAFRKSDRLNSIELPSGVTEIGKSAFLGCGALKSINIPASVTQISDKTFKKSGLTGVSFDGDSVTSIGDEAFYGCSELGSVTISTSLESIGKKAFMKCSAMTSLTAPATVKYIGAKAFYHCDNMESLTVPFIGTSAEKSAKQSITKIVKFRSDVKLAVTVNSPSEIGRKSFRNKTWISSVTLDDGITSIAGDAFEGMSGLVSVKMPSGFTEIPASMFEQLPSLRTVSGMGNVTSVGSKAFFECNALESVDLATVESIGESAFEGCGYISALGSLSFLKTVSAKAFYDCDGITEIADLAVLTSVGASAFESCNSLRSFIFPSTMTNIGERAFAYCEQLSSVDLSSASVATVGSSAFSNCSALNKVALSANMTDIPERMFYGCSSLDNLNSITNLAELNLKNIGNSAFEGCGSQTVALNIPEGVTSIGGRAFANTQISSVKMANSVTGVGEGAFDSCVYLNTASVPFLGSSADSSDTGYSWTFGTSGVKNVTLSKTATVTAKTFDGAKNILEAVSLPKTARIEATAFKDFTSLSSINLTDTLTFIGESAFENCGMLSTVNIPSGVTSIPARAFKGCTRLRISDFSALNLTSIGEEAFRNTSVGDSGSIAFNSGLVSVGKNAFANCRGIINVRFSQTMTKVDKDAFGEDPELKILIASVELYEMYTELFADYKNINVGLI